MPVRIAARALVVIVLLLLWFGVVMLYSTSIVKGSEKHGDPGYFLKRQLAWLALAVVAAAVSARGIDYHFWRKRGLAAGLVLLAVALLAVILVPGVKHKINGAYRWLVIGGTTIGQPSEMAKFACVVALAGWMTHVGRRAVRLKDGLAMPLGGLGVVLALIFVEPDYGTTFLLGLVGMSILFVGGARLSGLVVIGTLGVCAFALAVMQNALRAKRLLAFVWPEADPNTAYQLRQAVYAFVLGGEPGVGIGNSIQKLGYLPEASTDCILPVIGEELGVVGTVVVIVLFLCFLICGMVISLKSVDLFGRLLGFGLTMTIVLQAAINIAVVTGCMPTKGLPLPFISSGGSNLVMCMFSVGVLINIARHAAGDVEDVHTRAAKDTFRGDEAVFSSGNGLRAPVPS